MKKQPYTDCPRFDRCSVNYCPLDPETTDSQRVSHQKDREPKCTIEKGVRTRISNLYPGVLKEGGLTKREHASLVSFARLTPAVKAERAERARGNLRLAKRGLNDQNPQS